MDVDVHALITAGYFADWIIRIGSLFIVPRNRKPSSATAWLMLIMLWPIVGLIVFIFIGSPKLPRRRRAMQQTMNEIINGVLDEVKQKKDHSVFFAKDLTPRQKSIIDLNTNLGGLPAFQGNKIELLPDYHEAIKAIVKDVQNAKRYVHIEYFILALDDETEVLFDAMADAVKRGVKVRVLFDAIGSRSYPGHKQMKQRLDADGILWHAMLPLSLWPGKEFLRPDLRNHRKIVVIDGQLGYTGSQNLIRRNYHRKDELYYDELVARIHGPVVMQLQAAFVTDWYTETNDILSRAKHPELAFDPKKAGDVLAQVLPSGPGFENDNNLKLFTSLIHSAKKRVVITNPYFVPDDSLMVAITSAAQRGVEVIMLNSKIMDQKMVGHAQRSYYEELLKAGVKIYLYEWPILLHSKHMTIDDDIAVIGSSNLDMRSFQLDLEVTLIAYDPSVVRSLNKIEKMYMNKSDLVHLSEWQLRPLRYRLYDNLARLTAALQ